TAPEGRVFEAEGPGTPEPSRPPRALLANGSGLYVFDVLGDRHALLCAGPSAHPRPLGDGSVLFLDPAAGRVVRCSAARAQTVAILFEGLAGADRAALEEAMDD